MSRRLKNALWIGVVAVVPGLWAVLLVRNIAKSANERKEFREHIRRTYGNNFIYDDYS